ncbi:hypothetical protein [Hymenobacter sp. BRD67]|uniref:hypothetical protein n=1 Tax=Hymenobacter sp. BRD67 TaxID=2675877 RepID=UPI001566AC8A|nr:hypothetical protein [Hymenobacter sp. BRD67]QKG54885.1 hypothetical protein GKZ67_20880 [Hymenobacter sp. BRD67]
MYTAYGFGPAERSAIAQFYAAPSSASADDEAPADEDDEADDSAAPGSPDDVAFALWQWLLGAAFGRWDARLALAPPACPPGRPFEALPPAPPGALRHPATGRLAATAADVVVADVPYPIPVAWSGVLPSTPTTRTM